MPDPLNVIREAHSRGFTPVPLLPNTKRPAREGYVTATYQSEEDAVAAFTKVSTQQNIELTDLNVGLSLGPLHGGLVDIDVDHPKASLIASSLLPETAMRSGHDANPGSHFWYVVDDHDPGIRQYKLPSGSVIIEYRGRGGQTVVPDSIHPDTGAPYRWEGTPWGGVPGPTRTPGEQLHAQVLLIAMMVTLADGWPQKGSRHDAYLALVGGLLRDADEDGMPRVHPLWDKSARHVVSILAGLTHDADGAEARVSESLDSTRRKIVQGKPVQGWPTLATIIGDKHVQKVREWVEEIEQLADSPRNTPSRGQNNLPQVTGDDLGHFQGEPTHTPTPTATGPSGGVSGDSETPEEKAARLAAKPLHERDPLAERASSWEAVDLAPIVLSGWEPPKPGMIMRSDGVGLLYPGRVNSLYGSGGSGKTLIALDLARQVMATGQSVMMIDFEDEPTNTVKRLRDLGCPEQFLIDGMFTYVAPDDAHSRLQRDKWGQPKPTERGIANAGALAQAVDRSDPALVMVDGVTTLYSLHGLDPNDAAATDVIGQFLRGLTNKYKRTVLLIDHTPKTATPGAMPIGSQHKISMIQGAALQVHTTSRPRRGSRGVARLYVGKDRLGEVLAHSEGDDPYWCSEVVFDSSDSGALSITYDPPNTNVVDMDFSNVRTTSRQQPANGDSSAQQGGPHPTPHPTPRKGRGRPPGRDEKAQTSAEESVVKVLNAMVDPVSRKSLLEASGLTDYSFRRALDSLVSSGRVVQVGSSARGGTALFKIADQ